MGLSPAPPYQPPYLQTFDVRLAVAGSAPGANTLLVTRLPRVVAALPVTTCSVVINSQNGNIDIAVGTVDAAGTTFTKIVSTGSTAVAATNSLQTIALVHTFLPGIDYWAAFELDGTAQLYRSTAGIAVGNGWLPSSRGKAASTFPIGNTPALNADSGFMAWIGFK